MIPGAATLRDRFGVELADLAGTTLAGEIPFGEGVVNRLIAARIANHPQIASVRVQAQEADVVGIMVTPRSRLVPAIRVVARIERQPEFPTDPALLLRWNVPALGPLATMLAGPVLGFFTALPRGIRADGGRIAVDVRELLEAQGVGELAGFIRQAAIHTRPGGFVFRCELRIP